MKRPSVESIVAAIKDAYAATGRTPCRGRWLDAKTGDCCPMTALAFACADAKSTWATPDGIYELASAGRLKLGELLGDGVRLDHAFQLGFDGAAEAEPRKNLFVQAERYRPLTDAEYADYLWAFDVGQRLAQELGLTA